MKKKILILALFVSTIISAQGGYSPYSRLRLTSDPVLYSTSDQILVRDVTTGNIGKVSKASLFAGTGFALDADVLHKALNETITGNKTVASGKVFNFVNANYGIGTPLEDGLQIYSASNDRIRFGSVASGVFTDRLMIQGSTGNVGIGTTTAPTEKLDVIGNTKITGNLKLADGSGVTVVEDRNGSIVLRIGITGNATLPTTDNTGFESDATQKAIVTKENLYREFRSITSESSNRTLSDNDGTVYLISANPRTFTLPPASLTNQGKRYVVKNLSSGVTLTVNVTNGGLIDGVTSKQFNTQYSGCVVQSTGDAATGYIIIGTF